MMDYITFEKAETAFFSLFSHFYMSFIPLKLILLKYGH